MFKVKTIILILSLLTAVTYGWFDPSPDYYGRVIITRANTFETYSKEDESDIFQTEPPFTPLTGIDFFDLGDTDEDITASYGGNNDFSFYVAYPVTLYFWFQSPGDFEYNHARIQYFDLGSSADPETATTGSSTNWVDIVEMNEFETVHFDRKSVVFGFSTWTPPNTNNYYFIRVYAELEGGLWVNGELEAINITKDGDGESWQDYEILMIRAIPYQKPGTRAFTADERKFTFITDLDDIPFEPEVFIDEKDLKDGFIRKIWNRIKNIFSRIFNRSV